MKAGFISVIAAALLFTAQLAQAEQTVARKIESVDLQGADGGVVVRGIGAWGIYCGGAVVYNVYFSKATVSAYSEMLSMIMSAYIAGKTVSFYGGCAAPGVFNGTYLTVSQ